MGRKPSVATEKNYCENNLGYKFSHGDNKKAPGCGKCWCCKPGEKTIVILLNVWSIQFGFILTVFYFTLIYSILDYFVERSYL